MSAFSAGFFWATGRSAQPAASRARQSKVGALIGGHSRGSGAWLWRVSVVYRRRSGGDRKTAKGGVVPLQNRVTPFGEVVAVEARGAWMGNRGGGFHTPERRLTRRRWVSRRWIVCALEFRGWH